MLAISILQIKSKALVVRLYKVAKNRCLMSLRRSKFAPNPDLSTEEFVPDRKELEQIGPPQATAEELRTSPRGGQTEVVALLTATRFGSIFSVSKMQTDSRG